MSLSELQQENHALKLRICNLETMEREYEEEIEELRKEGRNLQSLLDERRFDARKDVTQDLNYTTTDEFRKIELQKEVEKYRHELEVSSKAIADLKSENAQLRHRVDILEISKESSGMNNNADTVSSELISKIESLTSKLIAEQKENKRMHILNSEKDEDLNSTRKINRELEAKFKNLREEITELGVEHDALKMQIGSVDNTRGNSLFSEVEDRRRRAEIIVEEQQKKIMELENKLADVQSEHQKILIKLRSESDSSMTTVYRQHVAKLYADNERLSTEVARLEAVENQLRDKYLGEAREKEKMHVAFGRDNSKIHGLNKTLEERLVAYKCAMDKAKSKAAALRERLMAEYRAHLDLKIDLVPQVSLVVSLTQELQMLKLTTTTSLATASPISIDSPSNDIGGADGNKENHKEFRNSSIEETPSTTNLSKDAANIEEAMKPLEVEKKDAKEKVECSQS